MKKKKLLMTASSYVHIRDFHLPYLKEFNSRGWETHLACTGVSSSNTSNIPYIDKTIDIPFEKKIISYKNFHSKELLRNLIAKEQYDLIITHTSLASFFTCLAVKGFYRRPRLAKVMHGYLFDDNTPILKKTFYLCAERFIAPETDLLMVMNEWDYRIAKNNKLSTRIDIIPGMGVDFERLDQAGIEDRIALREQLGIPSDATVLIYAAEFTKRKNQEFLIRAMKELPNDCFLVLPGDGETRETMRSLIYSLELSNRVFVPGYSFEIGKWFRMADIAVSSSKSEGLPFNVMEAMYAELPVIASAVKGHTDLIEDEKTGLLYSLGNETKFVKQTIRLINDPELKRIIKNNAKAKIIRYGLASVLPDVMERYLSVL